jgi:hypothetical protein
MRMEMTFTAEDAEDTEDQTGMSLNLSVLSVLSGG